MPAKVEGFDEARRKLRALADLSDRDQRKAVGAAANEFREEASNRAAPISPRLQRGIGIETRDTRDGAEADVGHRKEVFWGMFWELGFRSHPGLPHLRPAFDVKRSDAVRAASRVIKDAVMRIVRRG